MSKINWYKVVVVIGVVTLILLATGYVLGKKSIKCETEVVYIPGETIHDTINNPYEITIIKEIRPDIDTIALLDYCVQSGLYDYMYPTFDDSIPVLIVDTMAIIKDFIVERQYEIELFDIDTIGKCIINPIVQYNKISSVPFSFTPIQKVISIKKSEFNPFIGGTIGTGGFGFRGGLFMPYGIGVGLSWIRHTNIIEPKNDLMIDLYYKF